MEPQDFIISQLTNQGIGYNLLQDEFDPSSSCKINKVIKNWSKKFINGKYAPHLNQYLWHIFSFETTKACKGDSALQELKKQKHTKTIIFNEQRQYLIECFDKIPILRMDDFTDDIYLSHLKMDWTYVITHEESFGPYFSVG